MRNFIKKFRLLIAVALFIWGNAFGAISNHMGKENERSQKRILYTDTGLPTGVKIADINTGGQSIFYWPLVDGSGNTFLTTYTAPQFWTGNSTGIYFNWAVGVATDQLWSNSLAISGWTYMFNWQPFGIGLQVNALRQAASYQSKALGMQIAVSVEEDQASNVLRLQRTNTADPTKNDTGAFLRMVNVGTSGDLININSLGNRVFTMDALGKISIDNPTYTGYALNIWSGWLVAGRAWLSVAFWYGADGIYSYASGAWVYGMRTKWELWAIALNVEGISLIGNYSMGNYTTFDLNGFEWRYGSGLARDDIQNAYFFDGTVTAQIPSRMAIGWWNIDTRCFDGGSQMNEMMGSIEIPHDMFVWTGAILSPHVHMLAEQTAPTETGVWYMDYMILSNGQAYSWAAVKTISGSMYGFTARQANVVELDGNIFTGNIQLGDMVSYRIYRTPTGADTYSARMCLQQVGFHYQRDTNGSRQKFIK